MKWDGPKLNVAFVHDWLVSLGGAERVLLAMQEIFPKAPLFTLLYDPHGPCRLFEEKGSSVHASFLQKIPGAKKGYRYFLPLMPLAVEQFDLSAYDLIISSSFAVAKGVITGPDQVHISYVHSPIRYAWDLQHQYIRTAGYKGIKSAMVRLLLHYMRIWDYRTAYSPDYMIANSQFIARRIKKIYGRDAEVIYPPVEVSRFSMASRQSRENFYLTVSRLVPYKRVDLIVRAFSRMPDRELLVVGSGPEFQKIRKMAGQNVKLLGHVPNNQVTDLMTKTKAFVFAAEEDFGIAPVEAQAAGTPVIAYAKGGALETVIDGKTGIFFNEQTPGSLIQAVHRFEKCRTISVTAMQKNAERFSTKRFQNELYQFVRRAIRRLSCGQKQ